jgi:alpha-D-ribose 1-methylphosphonate 5-triphosphate synthase subunit PhnI
MWWGDVLRRAAAGLCAFVVAFGAAGAVAQDFAQPVADAPARLEVTVLHAELAKGAIDPQAARLHKLLAKRGLAYGTLRVVASKRAALMLGEIGAVMTPNAKEYRFRPLDRGDTGFLVAIDWGSTRGDFRMEPGVPLILGGQPKDGGFLWVVLELR